MLSRESDRRWKPVCKGAVAVASEIHGEKWQGLGLEQHNWAFKKEDPFRKWEV